MSESYYHIKYTSRIYTGMCVYEHKVTEQIAYVLNTIYKDHC